MKHAKPKKSQRIKHRQGFTDFLALGPDRSLEKLFQWYTENVPKPPCISIIKIWSTRYDWQARAAEHDERVAQGVSERVESAAVEESWDRIGDLTELAQRALKKAIDALKDDTMKAKDPYAVAALTNVVMAAIKGVELLEGRATGRLDNISSKFHPPEWIQERLATPAPPPTAAPTSSETGPPETATRH